jgi:hypothetical protein
MKWEHFRRKSSLLDEPIPCSKSSIHDFCHNIYFCSLLKKIDKKQDFIIYELYKQNKRLEWVIYFNLTIFFGLIMIYLTWIIFYLY